VKGPATGGGAETAIHSTSPRKRRVLPDDRVNGRPHEADCQADRPDDGPRGANAVRFHALVMTYHKPEDWQIYATATGSVPETPKDPP